MIVDKFVYLSTSDFSTLDFNLAKSTFLANFYVSIPVAFFKSDFVAKLDKSNSTFTLLLTISVLENIYSFSLCLFYQSNC